MNIIPALLCLLLLTDSHSLVARTSLRRPVSMTLAATAAASFCAYFPLLQRLCRDRVAIQCSVLASPGFVLFGFPLLRAAEYVQRERGLCTACRVGAGSGARVAYL